MKKYLSLLFLLIFAGCNQNELESKILNLQEELVIRNEEIITKDQEIATLSQEILDLSDNTSYLENKYVELSFNMTDKDVDMYYKKLDGLIDSEKYRTIITKEEYTDELYAQILKERTNPNLFFKDSLEVQTPDGADHIFGSSPLTTDEYLNIKNYHFRESNSANGNNSLSSIIALKQEPLKLSMGYLFFDIDLPVYKDDLDNPIGYLKKGTVIRLRGIELNSEYFTFNTGNVLQQVKIRLDDIPIIKKLIAQVRYRIINDKPFRIIGDEVIEIKTMINLSSDGTRYIRPYPGYPLVDAFYCWEYMSDIYFDESGDFLKYGYDDDFGH